MRVWVLGSGSSGNAVLVECGESRVLVDAGFGTRMLAMRLKAIGVAPAVDRGVHRDARAHRSREGGRRGRAALGMDAVCERGNRGRVAPAR